MENRIKMDDEQGYPFLWKPPCGGFLIFFGGFMMVNDG